MRGKADALMEQLRQAKDHPRACGEKPYSNKGVLEAQGSPPRMRGKVEE